MAAPNVNDLLEESKCYTCLGVSLSDALRLALLARIADGGGGSSGEWAVSYDDTPVALPYVFVATVNTQIEVNYFLDTGVSGTGEMTFNISGAGPVITPFRTANITNTGGAAMTQSGVCSLFLVPGQTLTVADNSGASGVVSILNVVIYQEQ